MDILKKISEDLEINYDNVVKTVNLLDEGNTVPFIARYRKEVTGNLTDEKIRDLNDRLSYLRNLEARKAEVRKSIEGQGKLTDQIEKELEDAQKLTEVEDIYLPYKPKKRTRA
ncbi:MAG: Tex-like N-terminal domain-containing protein, partial [Finegoldia sp.]|nr:Tex-like N-terminal domain-containing protein [Finegoldia sp.]